MSSKDIQLAMSCFAIVMYERWQAMTRDLKKIYEQEIKNLKKSK